jgi:hypothetical protein
MVDLYFVTEERDPWYVYCFATEERDPWYIYYVLLQKKRIHGRSTMFCYRRKGSMVGLLCFARGKGSMVGLLYFATEERDPW